MGRSQRELRCTKHPKHIQSKGVCASCLRIKLSDLSATTSSSFATTNIDNYSSSSSSYSSDEDDDDDDDEEEEEEEEDRGDDEEDESELSSSDASTPDHQYKEMSKRMTHFSGTRSGRWPLLMARSRSFGFVSRDRIEEKIAEKKEKKKKKERKENFWSKLIIGGSSRKRKGSVVGVELFHSRTMKERSSSRWVSVT